MSELIEEVMAAGAKFGLPTSVVEAEYMEKMGFAYLREHAPERLTPEALARPLPAPADRYPPSFHVLLQMNHFIAQAARRGDSAETLRIANLTEEIEKLFPEGREALDRVYPTKFGEGC